MSSAQTTYQPINHLSDTEARWFAVYTKYKAEKYVAEKLQNRGIETYVPLIKKTKKYDKKIKKYEVPLINSYVFVKIKKDVYTSVLDMMYVHYFIKQNRDLISIPDREINILKKVVGEFPDLSISNQDWIPGQKVEIIAGNLTGIKGHLVKKQGKQEFIVALDQMGFQLQMTIDSTLLMPTF